MLILLSILLARFGRYLFERIDARRMSRQQLEATDLSIQADIPYIADGTAEHLLDIYRPRSGAENMPVIVNIHGGGLFASYKTVNTNFNYEWARMGYAVVSLSYRRIPDTTLIHQITDVMTALRFINEHRKQYGLNLNTCYITADSAGALLALFAMALEGSEHLQQLFGIKACGIRFRAAALISIMLDTRRKDLLSFLRNIISAREEKGKSYLPYIFNPAAMVEETQLPPLYLVTSAEDIIRKDTLKLDSILTAAGVEHRLHDFPKGKQTKLGHVFSVIYPQLPESRQVYAEIHSFFQSH